MELTGPIEVLRRLQRTPGALAIYTDSTYVIHGIREWIWAWRRRGWKTAEGGDVLNRELWEQLARPGRGARQERRSSGTTYAATPAFPATSVSTRSPTPSRSSSASSSTTGRSIRYPIAVLDLPDDTSVPKRTDGGIGGKSKAPAYSYLSVVDGQPMRHATWAECERRVKGRSGAKFKKAMSAADEARDPAGLGVWAGGCVGRACGRDVQAPVGDLAELDRCRHDTAAIEGDPPAA